jgi:hypothetical protein
MNLTVLVNTAFTEPGILPRDGKAPEKYMENPSYCSICSMHRPQRTKHCRHCDNCVMVRRDFSTYLQYIYTIFTVFLHHLTSTYTDF